ncbi:MAG TPA: hypothetical protein PKI19_11460 [Elusimicrobiales bacterium]|nr:hypothetical protein [Elusimicrobiales bacterium]
MTLKNATLVALIGTSAAFALTLLQNLINFHIFNLYFLQSLAYNVPLIIFFYVLYKKQQ